MNVANEMAGLQISCSVFGERWLKRVRLQESTTLSAGVTGTAEAISYQYLNIYFQISAEVSTSGLNVHCSHLQPTLKQYFGLKHQTSLRLNDEHKKSAPPQVELLQKDFVSRWRLDS